MGDMADDAYMRAEEQEAMLASLQDELIEESERIISSYAFGDLSWGDPDVSTSYIDEMSLSHLENCLRMVKGRLALEGISFGHKCVLRAWIRVFTQEIRMRHKQPIR